MSEQTSTSAQLAVSGTSFNTWSWHLSTSHFLLAAYHLVCRLLVPTNICLSGYTQQCHLQGSSNFLKHVQAVCVVSKQAQSPLSHDKAESHQYFSNMLAAPKLSCLLLTQALLSIAWHQLKTRKVLQQSGYKQLKLFWGGVKSKASTSLVVSLLMSCCLSCGLMKCRSGNKRQEVSQQGRSNTGRGPNFTGEQSTREEGL